MDQVRGNDLLAGLATVDPTLAARGEVLSVPAGAVLASSSADGDFVYFPTTAVLSVRSVMPNRAAMAIALIGREGMAPIAAFHGDGVAAEQLVVHLPGIVVRLPASVVGNAAAVAPGFGDGLRRFTRALYAQVSHSAACTRRHSVAQRCARWLLMTHDRVDGNAFELTHGNLAEMLGVRRSSVSLAAETLKAGGAIDYSRGRVEVTDRGALERFSCGCHAQLRNMYARLLEPPAPALRASAESALTALDGRIEDAREQVRRLLASLRGAPLESSRRIIAAAEDIALTLEALQVAEAELSEQVRALEEMRNTAEGEAIRWRERFDNLVDALIETDEHDAIVEVNSAALSLLGRSRESLIGKPVQTLIPLTHRRGLRAALSDVRNRTESQQWLGGLSVGAAGASNPGEAN